MFKKWEFNPLGNNDGSRCKRPMGKIKKKKTQKLRMGKLKKAKLILFSLSTHAFGPLCRLHSEGSGHQCKNDGKYSRQVPSSFNTH